MFTTIKTLWERTKNKSEIVRLTGHDWKTVAKIVKAVESGKTRPEKKLHSKILDPFREKIVKWIEYENLNALKIYERLVSNGVKVAYSTVKKYISSIKKRENIFIRMHTKPMAKELVKYFVNLSGVMDADPELLREIDGIGPKSAEFISALREAVRRYGEESIVGKDIILNSPKKVIKYMRSILFSQKEEVFKAVYLTAKNKVLGIETLVKGTIDHATIYPRKIFETAVRYGAAALILVHNHPSGNAEPSPDDEKLTRNISRICAELDIKLHDHIIIGRNSYYSFNERKNILSKVK